MKPENVDGSVVAKLRKLHPNDIPHHLMQKNPVRNVKDFDPNIYFTVLTHLAMKSGFTLDYVYHYEASFSGYPCLYARPVDEKPFESYVEYQDCDKKGSLFSFLVADGSRDGFFQLAVFHRLSEQFYLYWHANYYDIRILTTPEETEALISEVNGEEFLVKFTDRQTAGMRRVETQPTVELSDDLGSVTYSVFTKWGGLARIRESFRRQPPHLLIDRELLDELKYDCHVCY